MRLNGMSMVHVLVYNIGICTSDIEPLRKGSYNLWEFKACYCNGPLPQLLVKGHHPSLLKG